MSYAPPTSGRIVVGTDFSDRAERAVAWAAERAATRGAPLLILMSLPEVPIPRRSHLFDAMLTGDYPAVLRDRAERRLDEERERVRAGHPGLAVETSVVEGVASAVLAEASKDAALVVVGARGHTAPASVRFLGGTADAVAAHAHGPVAVVTEIAEPVPGGPVVVGVDDSAEARAAIRFAADEAAARGVALVAVHAWDITPMVAVPGPWLLVEDDLEDSLAALAREIVDGELGDRSGVPVEIRVVPGRPSGALVEASRGASVLVVGSRGRGGFTGLLLGSTSREVLRDAHCPVVVVRS